MCAAENNTTRPISGSTFTGAPRDQGTFNKPHSLEFSTPSG
jgi:hypothetical protein